MDQRLFSRTESQARRKMAEPLFYYLAAMAHARPGVETPQDYFRRQFPESLGISRLDAPVRRAAVGAAVGGLLTEFSRDYMLWVFPFTVIARAGLRRAPFNVAAAITTTASGSAFIGTAQPATLTRQSVGSDTLPNTKCSSIVAASKDLLRFGSPGTMDFLLDGQRDGTVAAYDRMFTDPAETGTPGVQPASITSGVAGIPSSGDPDLDLKELIRSFVAGGGKLESAELLLSSQNAVAMRLRGNDAYRQLTTQGGTVAGINAIASESLEDRVILLDTSRVLLADDGAVDATLTTAAAVEMDDTPTQDGAAGTGASLVSLWQNNMIGLKVDKFISWTAREGSVAYVEDANYLATGSPA